jgi:hypothetical protein
VHKNRNSAVSNFWIIVINKKNIDAKHQRVSKFYGGLIRMMICLILWVLTTETFVCSFYIRFYGFIDRTRILKPFDKIVDWSPIKSIIKALYLSSMPSTCSFYIFDSHEHDVSEFPHTCLKFGYQSSIDNVSLYQHAMHF